MNAVRYFSKSGNTKSLKPFHKLLSYNEAESIHTGFDAYRDYFQTNKKEL